MNARGTAAWAASLLLFAAPSPAREGDGASSFHFLNLGSGARTEALSGAATAMAEGVDALAWNPARLALDPAPQVSASFFTWLHDVRSGYVGGVLPLGARAGVGLAVRSLSVSDFENVPGEPAVGQSDFAISLGGGYSLLESLAAGVAFQAVRSSVADVDASGWAVDAGLNYRYVEGWDVVWAVRNAGPSFAYGDGADEQLPSQSVFGLSGTIRELRFDSEVIWERGPGWTGALGAEYWLGDRLALRAGSRFGWDGGDGVEPWSAGLGIRARGDLDFDYSIRDGKFDLSHRVGLRWTPGRPLRASGESLAPSPREYYLNALNRMLDESLASFPRDLADTILVRGSAVHEANKVISEGVAEYLRERGIGAVVLEPIPDIPDSLPPEAQKQIAENLKVDERESIFPVLEFEIVDSEYVILERKRARFIGPRSIKRRAGVELAFDLTEPGSSQSVWSSSGRAEETETVASSRVPPSPGYPRPKGDTASAKAMHPLVEPAIVGGIVAGLAVIFFSNRNVGE